VSSQKWNRTSLTLSFALVLNNCSLVDDYKRHAKKLRVTGGGIGGDDDAEKPPSSNPVEFMDFYIPSSGPDDTTPDFAKNLWGKH